jgi:hypothetical protein
MEEYIYWGFIGKWKNVETGRWYVEECGAERWYVEKCGTD